MQKTFDMLKSQYNKEFYRMKMIYKKYQNGQELDNGNI